MKTALVGYTGFVGSNLKTLYYFTELYNSKNIQDSYGTKPDLLVYAGLPAAMFKANANADADFADILQAIDNIKAIGAKQIVLISTVAVYDKTYDVDETHVIDKEALLPYGKNRLYLEKWVEANCENRLIVRLPAIYGNNLKKNFIYDYINVIPALLNEKKYRELVSVCNLIEKAYFLEEDTFYHFFAAGDLKRKVYEYFSSASFNAINFTDSRSIYQFYNLNRLWSDIIVALQEKISLLNVVAEPVSVSEVYKYLSNADFKNELSKEPYNYNIQSIHAAQFGSSNKYLINKEEELADLKRYVDEEKKIIWG